MVKTFDSQLVRRVTGASSNQMKYWVKIGLVVPEKQGKKHYYSFRDVIKLRMIVALKAGGLSLQRIKRGINNLKKVLPQDDDPLPRLTIHTDGQDIIVVEKGTFFSATTRQRLLKFDTAQLQAEIVRFQAYHSKTYGTKDSYPGMASEKIPIV